MKKACPFGTRLFSYLYNLRQGSTCVLFRYHKNRIGVLGYVAREIVTNL